jgi:hypothetical protein
VMVLLKVMTKTTQLQVPKSFLQGSLTSAVMPLCIVASAPSYPIACRVFFRGGGGAFAPLEDFACPLEDFAPPPWIFKIKFIHSTIRNRTQ